MKQIVFHLDSDRTVQVLPDTLIEMDGHPIISYTYSLFKHTGKPHESPRPKPNVLDTDHILDPDYLGFITFEEPGRVFSYTSSGNDILSTDEVTELIEKVTELRENPQSWDSIDNL